MDDHESLRKTWSLGLLGALLVAAGLASGAIGAGLIIVIPGEILGFSPEQLEAAFWYASPLWAPVGVGWGLRRLQADARIGGWAERDAALPRGPLYPAPAPRLPPAG